MTILCIMLNSQLCEKQHIPVLFYVVKPEVPVAEIGFFCIIYIKLTSFKAELNSEIEISSILTKLMPVVKIINYNKVRYKQR